MLLNKPGNQSSLVCDLSAFFVLFGNVRIKDKEFVICKGVPVNKFYMAIHSWISHITYSMLNKKSTRSY